ncbi:hypothetical protein HZ326_21800 [Fusarium oxysporum f. sp. albedinis]|nr:hypothetical protein HZ326_21800 [Fusarium oxysporum f. sp. albedinis]
MAQGCQAFEDRPRVRMRRVTNCQVPSYFGSEAHKPSSIKIYSNLQKFKRGLHTRYWAAENRHVNLKEKREWIGGKQLTITHGWDPPRAIGRPKFR